MFESKWRVAPCMIVAYRINQPGSRMAMGGCLRNKQRVSHFPILVTDTAKVGYINIGAKHVNSGCSIFPDLHHPCNRPSVGIHTCFFFLIQPAVYRHGNIIHFFPGGSDSVDKACNMVSTENFFRHISKSLAPCMSLFSGFHTSSYILCHFPCTIPHIVGKLLRHIAKYFIGQIRMLPCRSLYTGFIFHLYHNHGFFFFIPYL